MQDPPSPTASTTKLFFKHFKNVQKFLHVEQRHLWRHSFILTTTCITSINNVHTCCTCYGITGGRRTLGSRWALTAAHRINHCGILSHWTSLRKRATVCTGMTNWTVVTFCSPTKWILPCPGTGDLSLLWGAAEITWSASDADSSIVARDFSWIATDWQFVSWFTDLTSACIGTLCTGHHWKNKQWIKSNVI